MDEITPGQRAEQFGGLEPHGITFAESALSLHFFTCVTG